jgi:hypothetical protein
MGLGVTFEFSKGSTIYTHMAVCIIFEAFSAEGASKKTKPAHWDASLEIPCISYTRRWRMLADAQASKNEY